jgi:DNA ligase-1
MDFVRLINDLQSTSSRNAKIEMLRDFATSLYQEHFDTFMEIVRLVYDPQITFGVKFTPDMLVPTTGEPDYSISAIALLNDLASRKLTGNAAKEAVYDLFARGSDYNKAVLFAGLEKSFGAGVDEKTIRKVFQAALPVKINMMKCEPATAKTLARIYYPARLELKIDAMRVNVIVPANGEIEYITYNGTKFYVSNPALREDMIDLAKRINEETKCGYPIYLDGEMLILDERGNIQPRKISNGLANRILKDTAPLEIHARVHIVLWDFIDQTSMQANVSTLCNEERFRVLQNNIERTDWASLVEYSIVSSEEQAQEVVAHWIKRGEEGGVIKNLNAFWEGKRSQNCVKFKAEKEADMIVTGWYPGEPTGNRAHGIGGLVCESIEGKVRVDVGGGLDEDDVASDPKDWIGRIVTIRFNEVISRKGSDVMSLFLPRIVEKRVDKDFADSAKTIMEL